MFDDNLEYQNYTEIALKKYLKFFMSIYIFSTILLKNFIYIFEFMLHWQMKYRNKSPNFLKTLHILLIGLTNLN